MEQPNRQYAQNEAYRFGYQNQEKDPETNTIFYKYRIADARIGRFWSVDPLADEYPYNSQYAFSENRVIDGVELEGLEFANPDWVYWAISPLLKYVSGGIDLAKTNQKHKERSGYTENVPEETREVIHKVEQMQAVGKTMEGGKEIIERSLLGMNALEGAAILGGGTIALRGLGTRNNGPSDALAKGKLFPETEATKTRGMYIPKTPLAQQKVAGWDIPLPDPLAGNFPHTTLGGKIGSDGILYRQSATFTGGSWPLANGKIVPWSRVDWTTHGRPLVHPNPHQHIFNFNNGKNWQYGKAVPFP